ncbi:hypothetical protein VNO77_02409 [Canavalia gladiata]|uniref:Bet v I/Major latex protein domain-containing protein n=1 Tax=Canavalia gladiata TaxID=3824 RepID=A0AAN9MV15_CANGL
MEHSQLRKVECSVHIKASGEKFLDLYSNKTHHIAKICPDKVQAVNIHKGEWGSVGSIISWNYVHEGKACVAKEVIEDIDKKNNKMIFKVIEGDLVEEFYKSFKLLLEVIPKGNGSEVHWVLEYEKQNDNVPDPHTILHFLTHTSKDIDAYITKDIK